MSNEIHYGRKRNGIKKELHDKLTEWANSITDESVRNLVKKNTIVTGGSIASMLLGEPINDYDVYFKDYETTLAVAKYYVDEFNKNTKLIVAEGVTPYQPHVQTHNDFPGKFNEERVMIYMKSAGVAGERQITYDYFESCSADDVAKFADSLKDTNEPGRAKYRPIFLSPNAITLSNDVQIVIRFFGSPEEIHGNYDFAHAMCYYDWDKYNLVLPAEALECLLSRTLLYHGSLYPLATIYRVRKFIERGWRISVGQLTKICWQISELDMSNHDVLTEQLTGVDAAYLFQLIQALKDVDSSKIDSTYVAEIIDRIFD